MVWPNEFENSEILVFVGRMRADNLSRSLISFFFSFVLFSKPNPTSLLSAEPDYRAQFYSDFIQIIGKNKIK